MNTFRAHWQDGPPEIPTPRRLRAVPHSAPRRPHWTALYLWLLGAAAAGSGLHLLVREPWEVRVVDVLFGFGLFGILAAWIHGNRGELTRLDEPDVGVGRTHVRIVRSRAPGLDEIEPPDVDDRIVLPYEFR